MKQNRFIFAVFEWLSACLVANAETNQLDLINSEEPDFEVWEAMGDSDETIVSNGWVVVDGELLHSPYHLVRNANGIKINNRLYGCRWPVVIFQARTLPPTVPADFPSNSISIFETDQGQKYWHDCEEYLRTIKTNSCCQADDFLPLIRAIPSVSHAWTEEWQVEFENPINPPPKLLKIEWSANTNDVECLNILDLTTHRWNTTEEEKQFLNQRVSEISTILQTGGLVLSLPVCLGGNTRNNYFRNHIIAADFISRMEEIAVGTVATNEISTALDVIFPSGDCRYLEPLFSEHLESYLMSGN